MTQTFRITPRARLDLMRIGRHTLKNWGEQQCKVYLRDMDKRFAWLAQHRELGRPRPDIHAGYYSYPQGSHVIFYLIREGGIDIIGIPHQRMDILSYFLE